MDTKVKSMASTALNLLSKRALDRLQNVVDVSFSLGKLTSPCCPHLPPQPDALMPLSSGLKRLKKLQSLVGLQGTWPFENVE